MARWRGSGRAGQVPRTVRSRSAGVAGVLAVSLAVPRWSRLQAVVARHPVRENVIDPGGLDRAEAAAG